MYAVVRAGGKQHKVSKGDVIEVERLDAHDGEVRLEPVLVVTDDGAPRSLPSELAGAIVTGKVLGEVKGPKVRIFKYRPKTGYRRRKGHRQRYTRIEIADIAIDRSTRPARSKSKEQVEGNGS
jgi:large subunit ribosomal protein L21